MNWTSIRAWAGTVARLVLGGVWLWAAFSKIGSPRTFVQAVRAYDATPEWLSKAIGYGLPVLEICIGILLVLGVITRVAAAVSGLLLLVFVIGIVQAAARGIKLDCGCFGGGGQTTGATTYTLDILRDVGLIVLAVFLVVWPITRISVDEYLARHDEVAMPSAKRMRTDQGRRKYNAMVESRRKEARIRTTYLSAGLGAVVVLVSVIGIGVQANRAKIQGDLSAANASVQNGVVVGKASAPVTVDVFEDFQCPACENFETTTGKDVQAKIDAGTIKVRYHTLAFLDASSNGNRYSSRADNAALCASDISTEEFKKYHDVLYGRDAQGHQVQPAEGSNGRPDSDFINYAKQIGIKDTSSSQALTTFTQCVQGETHKALVQAITDNASKRNVNQTPTIWVDGKDVKNPDQKTFDAAVSAALAKKGVHPAPASSGAPSPSGSASPSASASASAPKAGSTP